MDGHDHGRSLTHRASADIGPDALLVHRHHGNHLGRGQPETVVVSGCHVAHVVYVAEHERHRAETAQTGAGAAEVLSRGPFVALNVQQTVAPPHLRRVHGASGHVFCLAVARQVEAKVGRSGRARLTRGAIDTIQAVVSLGASLANDAALSLVTCGTNRYWLSRARNVAFSVRG